MYRFSLTASTARAGNGNPPCQPSTVLYSHIYFKKLEYFTADVEDK